MNHYLGISSDIETGTKEWYKEILKAGYKYAYCWINSDTNWMYFAKNISSVEKGAIELYAKEKSTDVNTAKKYYSEYVDIYPLAELINNN